jgi:hypothetical protein
MMALSILSRYPGKNMIAKLSREKKKKGAVASLLDYSFGAIAMAMMPLT